MISCYATQHNSAQEPVTQCHSVHHTSVVTSLSSGSLLLQSVLQYCAVCCSVIISDHKWSEWMIPLPTLTVRVTTWWADRELSWPLNCPGCPGSPAQSDWRLWCWSSASRCTVGLGTGALDTIMVRSGHISMVNIRNTGTGLKTGHVMLWALLFVMRLPTSNEPRNVSQQMQTNGSKEGE